jgi:hypothetical protein
LSKTFAVDPKAEQQFSLAEIDAAVQELLGEGQKPPDAAASAGGGESDKSEEPGEEVEKDAGAANRTDP